METWAEYTDKNENTPLYPFGYGLSYTTFQYDNLSLPSAVTPDGKLMVSFTVKNSGTLRGDEIAQVYVRDCESSVARPVKQLGGFARVGLETGETKEIAVELDMRLFAFHDIDMEQIVEPGKMEIYIGSSSEDIRLKGGFEITGERLVVERKAFSSRVAIKDRDGNDNTVKRGVNLL
jgi:beta-glucosidase